MICDGCLKEEWKVGEDWSQSLFVDLHSGEKLAQDDHVNHNRYRQQGVLANVVGHDSVDTSHEDLWAILINSSLWISNERYVANNDVVINLVRGRHPIVFAIALWVKNPVWLDCVIKDPSFRNFLGLKALILWKILSIVVTQMVVGDDGGQPQTWANQIVWHHCLEASLTRLKVTPCKETLLLSSVLHNCFVKSVLWRAIQVENLLLDGGHTIEDWGRECFILFDHYVQVLNCFYFW